MDDDDDDAYFSAIHEASHCVIGKHFGLKIERIVMRQNPVTGYSFVSFTDVTADHRAAMIICCYAGDIAERKEGRTERRDKNDQKQIAEFARAAGYGEHQLATFKRVARTLVNLYQSEIYALAMKLHVRGIYRFRGERLVYCGEPHGYGGGR